jgi:hypothetical protein
MAFSLSSRELAGLKFNHVDVASRKHISAKNRVCKSSDESNSMSYSIEFLANFLRLWANSILSILLLIIKQSPPT